MGVSYSPRRFFLFGPTPAVEVSTDEIDIDLRACFLDLALLTLLALTTLCALPSSSSSTPSPSSDACTQ